MDFNHLISLGIEAHRRGDIDTYRHCLQMGSEILRRLMITGQKDLALSAEPIWYNRLVKLTETEENCHFAFSGHVTQFFESGKSLGVTTRQNGARISNHMAFVLHTGALLGHTEVMLTVLRNWRHLYPWIKPVVVSLNGMNSKLADALDKVEVPWRCAPNIGSPIERIKWASDVCNQEQVQTAVWVSTPCWISFVFGHSLAPKQVLWSLKFHAVHLGENVIHVGMTKPSSKPVTIFGNRWLSFSPPLVAGVSRLDNLEIQRVRNRFPHKVIFGTFAREEKFNSSEFLRALVTIMTRAPSAHFLYTGRHDSHQIREALSNAGLLDRATYIGWVDTNLMSQVIDVFLETFPFGCGVTGAQAVELGTEVISLWGGDTLPTYYFETYEEARSFKKSWRVCASISEYVEAAINCLNSVSNQSTDNQVFRDSLNLSDLDAKKPEQLLRLFGLPTQAPGP